MDISYNSLECDYWDCVILPVVNRLYTRGTQVDTLQRARVQFRLGSIRRETENETPCILGISLERIQPSWWTSCEVLTYMPSRA